jgi:hypothetical protein
MEIPRGSGYCSYVSHLIILKAASTNVMPKKGESWPGDDPELEDEPERTPSRTQVAVRSHRATNSVGSKVPY